MNVDLEKYCKRGIEYGSTHAKIIHPSSVVTAAWVRLKCHFGCWLYNKGYCCPPYTPTSEETRELLDCYHHAILFHKESPETPEREKSLKKYYERLIDLEEEIFKDGYYKAFVLLCGPCLNCKECNALKKAEPCKFGSRARPSMEACGIDVFQTARNNGFFVKTLSKQTETRNQYCLMLVD